MRQVFTSLTRFVNLTYGPSQERYRSAYQAHRRGASSERANCISIHLAISIERGEFYRKCHSGGKFCLSELGMVAVQCFCEWGDCDS
jgi:hypothetical protein